MIGTQSKIDNDLIDVHKLLFSSPKSSQRPSLSTILESPVETGPVVESAVNSAEDSEEDNGCNWIGEFKDPFPIVFQWNSSASDVSIDEESSSNARPKSGVSDVLSAHSNSFSNISGTFSSIASIPLALATSSPGTSKRTTSETSIVPKQSTLTGSCFNSSTHSDPSRALSRPSSPTVKTFTSEACKMIGSIASSARNAFLRSSLSRKKHK